MDKEAIQEVIALRLHSIIRGVVRVVYEESSLNCDWEGLPEYWKERYRLDAKGIIEEVETWKLKIL